ncbi:MAG TPA: hypothetical protein VIM11_27010 [Tepidisphaeraceae bacterium]|jgi:hypothetical protein
MKKNLDAYSQFMAKTLAQRQADVEKYDQEMPGLPGNALSAAGRAQHTRAKRKARIGRPRVGRGAKRVLITVEGALLKRADAYAKQHGLNRSELIARGLKNLMGSAA